MNASSDGPHVAVLIPYFQRDPGILLNTIRQVLTQEGFDNYQVIVVDDGSPVPARRELAEILSQHKKNIRIVEQENAGPGAARNKALDSLPQGIDYIAFLDSDDHLEPSYLADAVFALNQGYDLFFGNSIRTGIDQTRFEWDSESGKTIELDQHRLINPERGLYEFQGDFFDFVVFRSNIISTSVMMYRHMIGAGVIFNESIYNGQDRIFKLSLCQHTNKIAFSPRIYAREGKGINIFDSAGWGSERSLSLLSSYIDMCKYILRTIPLNERQRDHVRRHLATNRYNFTANLLHQARQGRHIDLRVVGKTLGSDPGTLLRFLPNVLKLLNRKVHRARLL